MLSPPNLSSIESAITNESVFSAIIDAAFGGSKVKYTEILSATGFAHVYADADSLKNTEMEYMINRHVIEDEPVTEEMPTMDDVSGGEE